ncbi:hypothetical protein EV356DRAFT_510361 [Viridothelium virens]|uniref:Uncharacterized protein n=1 Tax=Viridothelium virens TaxID=1048519 RepID=A0A6A6GUZ3_VIRVR|nr:hypothetical protein EV356DRAFT_510361 [Viridothelium virens]
MEGHKIDPYHPAHASEIASRKDSDMSSSIEHGTDPPDHCTSFPTNPDGSTPRSGHVHQSPVQKLKIKVRQPTSNDKEASEAVSRKKLRIATTQASSTPRRNPNRSRRKQGSANDHIERKHPQNVSYAHIDLQKSRRCDGNLVNKTNGQDSKMPRGQPFLAKAQSRLTQRTLKLLERGALQSATDAPQIDTEVAEVLWHLAQEFENQWHDGTPNPLVHDPVIRDHCKRTIENLLKGGGPVVNSMIPTIESRKLSQLYYNLIRLSEKESKNGSGNNMRVAAREGIQRGEAGMSWASLPGMRFRFGGEASGSSSMDFRAFPARKAAEDGEGANGEGDVEEMDVVESASV